MKNICFINGSPKGKKSNSVFLLNKLADEMSVSNYNKFYINVTASLHSGKLDEDFEAMASSDVLVIAFPLYVYCLPGVLMEFLEDFSSFLKRNNTLNNNLRVYAIVNCGFPEPIINEEAIHVLKNFCTRLNLNWRFAVSLAMGEMVGATKDIKFMQKLCSKVYASLHEINKDIENNIKTPVKNQYARPNFPIFLFKRIGKASWLKTAKSNGLSKEDLYKRPYLE